MITSKEATRSEMLMSGSILKIWKIRLPFLFFTLTSGLLAGAIMGGFEDVLEQIVMVAFFVPVLMSLGGSSGTQSSTLFARSIALGQIQPEDFPRRLVKEIGVGLSLGVIFGLICGTVAAIWAFLWGNTPIIGVAVGLALMTTMTIASLMGFLIPYMLNKFGFDQAAGSAPIITSTNDVLSLFIYFIVVSIFLSAFL
jgi:magnesium transporter